MERWWCCVYDYCAFPSICLCLHAAPCPALIHHCGNKERYRAARSALRLQTIGGHWGDCKVILPHWAVGPGIYRFIFLLMMESLSDPNYNPTTIMHYTKELMFFFNTELEHFVCLNVSAEMFYLGLISSKSIYHRLGSSEYEVKKVEVWSVLKNWINN